MDDLLIGKTIALSDRVLELVQEIQKGYKEGADVSHLEDKFGPGQLEEAFELYEAFQRKLPIEDDLGETYEDLGVLSKTSE